MQWSNFTPNILIHKGSIMAIFPADKMILFHFSSQAVVRNQTECPICLASLQPDDSSIIKKNCVLTSCSHLFHDTCLTMFETLSVSEDCHNSCPVCRSAYQKQVQPLLSWRVQDTGGLPVFFIGHNRLAISYFGTCREEPGHKLWANVEVKFCHSFPMSIFRSCVLHAMSRRLTHLI